MATASKAPVPSLVIAASRERLLKMELDDRLARVIELIDSEGSESDSDTGSSEHDEEMEQYHQKMRQLSPYDAIDPPPHARLYGGVSPYTVTDEDRPHLVNLCNLSLKKFNTKNQNAKFEFVKLVKVTAAVVTGLMFYFTFEAKNASKDAADDPPNNATCTFQAKVWDKMSVDEKPEVIDCRMKST